MKVLKSLLLFNFKIDMGLILKLVLFETIVDPLVLFCFSLGGIRGGWK